MPLTPAYLRFDGVPIKISVIVPMLDLKMSSWGPLQPHIVDLKANVPTELIVVGNNIRNNVDLDRLVMNDPAIDKWVKVSHNCGVGGAWNIGAALAEGETLIFINDDMEMSAESLQSISDALSNPEVGVVGVEGYDFSWHGSAPTENPNPECFRITGGRIAFDADVPPTSGRECHVVIGHAFGIRRDTLSQAGYFNGTFSPAFCEEFDLCWKVRERGLKVLALPLPYMHRRGISDAINTGRLLPFMNGVCKVRDHFAWANHQFHKMWFGK
jgi:GT2 family glycosyltransferase